MGCFAFLRSLFTKRKKREVLKEEAQEHFEASLKTSDLVSHLSPASDETIFVECKEEDQTQQNIKTSKEREPMKADEDGQYDDEKEKQNMNSEENETVQE